MKLKEGTYYTYDNDNYGDDLHMVILAISDIRFKVILTNNNGYFKIGEECNYISSFNETLIKDDLESGILQNYKI